RVLSRQPAELQHGGAGTSSVGLSDRVGVGGVLVAVAGGAVLLRSAADDCLDTSPWFDLVAGAGLVVAGSDAAAATGGSVVLPNRCHGAWGSVGVPPRSPSEPSCRSRPRLGKLGRTGWYLGACSCRIS